MGKLRDDTKEIAGQLTELSGRFGMVSDPNIPPEKQVDMDAMREMSQMSMTSAMSIYIPENKLGGEETSIPVKITFVSPADKEQPQAAQFTRMVADILLKNGVSSDRKSLENANDRELSFRATPGNAAGLATALQEINQFLEADKGQEQAVRDMLTKASRIETQFTPVAGQVGGRQIITEATKVAPTFEITKVKDAGSGATVNEPVFGVKIETNDPVLSDALTGVSNKNKSVKVSDASFSRVDIGKQEFEGKQFRAQGAALEDVMEQATKDRAALNTEQDQMRYSQVIRGDQPDQKKKDGSWAAGVDSDDGNQSIVGRGK
jgi:hypothetical protein